MRLRAKILISVILVFFITITATSLVSTGIFVNEQRYALENQSLLIARTLAAEIERIINKGVSLDLIGDYNEHLGKVVRENEIVDFAMVMSPRGKIVFSSEEKPGDTHEFSGEFLAALEGARETVLESTPDGETYLDTLVPVIDNRGNYAAMLHIGTPYRVIVDKAARLTLMSGTTALLGLVFGVAVMVAALSYWITNPIESLTAVINEASRDPSTDKRIPVRTGDEMGMIGEAFNAMLNKLQDFQHEVEGTARELERMVDLQTIANLRLQEMDNTKTMFIATMSHELRTPLNAIIGFTGVVLQGIPGEINAEQRKQLTMVRNSADHLLALVNDIIDMSKIEAGKIDLAIEAFDLGQLLEEVHASFAADAAAKGVALLAEAPGVGKVESDRVRIRQIVMNLVSNALKATVEGGITVKASRAGDGFRVSVEDTGCGMSREAVRRLFQPFGKVAAREANWKGTGLGLYLSGKIAGILGGGITVASEPGKGSIFVLEINVGDDSDEESADGGKGPG